MKRLAWLRAPEIVMICLGAAAFAVDHVRGDSASGDAALIQVPPRAQVLASPMMIVGDEIVEGESRDPVERWIRAEVLYREALRLRLDENDIVVRRRLVQKMEYALDNMAALTSPEHAELEAFFERNAEHYRESPAESFTQITFSLSDGADRALARADASLAQLKGRGAEAGRAYGDPIPDGSRVAAATEARLVQLYGAQFADGLKRAAVGVWDGPIRSRIGVHLVFRGQPTPSRIPELDEISKRVARDWVERSRAIAREARYAELAARYRVIAPGEGEGAGSATTAAAQRPASAETAAGLSQGAAGRAP